MTKQLYPFSLFTRIYLGTPQQWPIDPVETAKSGNGEPVYAQLSSPAQSAPDAPPAIPAGKLARRLPDDSGWELVEDVLGQWFDKHGVMVTIIDVDADVSQLTRTAPPDACSILVGGQWQPDPAKQLAARRAEADAAVASGMAEAARQIAVLQDAADVGMATPAETAAHTAWRKYRVLLSRVQSDPAYPTKVTLPQQPAKAVP